jgi:ubiquinone/menaquinone biosynthesis C-methylase UbiE
MGQQGVRPERFPGPGYNIINCNQTTSPMSQLPDKYSRSAILNPVKLRKGQTRWNQCAAAVRDIDAALLEGPMLDLGSGVGYFVREGLQRGLNIWGVDASAGKLVRFRKLVQYTGGPAEWQQRCLQADAEDLPFGPDRFAVVSSWYVLEHQRNPGVSLRELARVTRPGGVLAIKAQDARRGWEGHCKIPWIPFISRRMARVWAEEFGAAIERRDDVYDVTQPQVVAILESLGCEVVVQAASPQPILPGHWQIGTEDEVRRAARRIRILQEEGRWRPPPENLYLYAIKQ